MEPVIRAANLTRRFREEVAVDHVNLEIERGEIFGLLGHNGAGKTTTVRLLNGILAPDEGEARVLGLAPIRDGPALRRRVGVLTESPALDGRLSARENLLAYASLYDIDAPRARVDALLARFGLLEVAERRTASYSRGMQQRIAVVRALVHEPEVLYMDEPTNGLDPVAAHQVRDLILRLAREGGRTVVLCTHNLDEAARICDRVAVLRKGRLISIGRPSALAQAGLAFELEIEVEAPSADRTAEVLPSYGAVAAVVPTDGGRVFTIVGVDARHVPEVVAGLVKAGVRVRRVAPREHSLEEYYLRLDREAGPR